MSQKTKNLVLRMPPELHERVKAQAADNGRSMNSEIIARLENSGYDPQVVFLTGGLVSSAALPAGEVPCILSPGEYRYQTDFTPEQLASKPFQSTVTVFDENDGDPLVSLMQRRETRFQLTGRPLTETMQRLGMKGVIPGPKALEGTVWVLTGTLHPGLTKDKAREQLMSLGAVVAGRVTKDTYAVVKGFDAWTIAVQRASFFDVPQLSGAEFHQLMQDLGAIEK